MARVIRTKVVHRVDFTEKMVQVHYDTRAYSSMVRVLGLHPRCIGSIPIKRTAL